ncbi:MAG: universal stress protein [Pseudomonadota bacterium]
MTSHILIPVALDHEPIVPAKIALARQFLGPGGRITLLTVLESIPGFVSEFVTVTSENHLTSRIQDKLAQVAGDAADITVEVATGKPGVEIVTFAASNAVDLIIVGSHKPGVSDYFLGSTAARVARRAPCAVYIQR